MTTPCVQRIFLSSHSRGFRVALRSLAARSHITDSSDTTKRYATSSQMLKKRRNPVLAEVLREGLPLLNETAASIQASPYSRQSLFHRAEQPEAASTKEEEREATGGLPGMGKTFQKHQISAPYTQKPKYQYMLHHVREATMICIEDLLQKSWRQDDTVGDWSLKGEAVQILHIHLSSSMQHAVIHWTLPFSITENLACPSDDDLVVAQQRLDHVLELQSLLDSRWESSRADLSRAIQGHLRRHNRWMRVPAIRLEPATPAMLYDYVIMPQNPPAVAQDKSRLQDE